jgi:hypothetical protein
MLANTPLLEQARDLRRDAARRCPGRVAELVDVRVAQLVGTAPAGTRLPDDLTAGEQTVIDVVEQFLVDVHGITDGQFARLSDHYRHDEQVAILFHLALVDGFTKLDRVHAPEETTP